MTAQTLEHMEAARAAGLDDDASPVLVAYRLDPDTVPRTGPAAAQLILDLGGQFDQVSFSISDPDLSIDDWLTMGRMFSIFADGWQWWVGDWMLLGEGLFGQPAAQGSIDGIDPGYLSSIIRVALRVPRSVRREGLSFSHHKEVASLTPEEQAKWLKKAEKGGWTRGRLRDELRSARRAAKGLELAPGAGDELSRVDRVTLHKAILAMFGERARERGGRSSFPDELCDRVAGILGLPEA